MAIRSWIAAVLLGLLCVANAQVTERSPTLLQLLATPDRYDGREVMVTGYCRLEFEGFAIHLSKEDYKYDLGNQVWLDLRVPEDITPQRLKIEYCIVRGTYNAKYRGHMNLFEGAIQNIKLLEPWPSNRVR